MYVTLRLGESGEERKISSVSWELCLSPSYDEMGKKPKASSEEDYVVIFIFLFYFFFILGFKMVLDGSQMCESQSLQIGLLHF